MSRLSLRQRGVLAQLVPAGEADQQRHNLPAGDGSAGIPGRACARTGTAPRLRTARMRLSGSEAAGQARVRGDSRTGDHPGPTCPHPSMPRCSSKRHLGAFIPHASGSSGLLIVTVGIRLAVRAAGVVAAAAQLQEGAQRARSLPREPVWRVPRAERTGQHSNLLHAGNSRLPFWSHFY